MSSSAPSTPISYKDAGVDIDAGDALVERIKPLAKKKQLTLTLEPPLAEVRLRLTHQSQPVHREHVLRFVVKLPPPPK